MRQSTSDRSDDHRRIIGRHLAGSACVLADGAGSGLVGEVDIEDGMVNVVGVPAAVLGVGIRLFANQPIDALIHVHLEVGLKASQLQEPVSRLAEIAAVHHVVTHVVVHVS